MSSHLALKIGYMDKTHIHTQSGAENSLFQFCLTITTGGPDVLCVNILIFTWTKWDESSKILLTKIVQKLKYNKTKLTYL